MKNVYFKAITITVTILHLVKQATSSEIQKNLMTAIYSESDNDLIQKLFEIHIWN